MAKKNLGNTSDGEDLMTSTLNQQYRDNIANQNQPGFWDRLLMGNFAYDEYPENPSAFPAASPPAMPGDYQRSLSPTEYLEFMESVKIPEEYQKRVQQGPNPFMGNTPLMPAVQAPLPPRQVVTDTPPVSHAQAVFSGSRNRGTGNPVAAPVQAAPSMWERFRAASSGDGRSSIKSGRR